MPHASDLEAFCAHLPEGRRDAARSEEVAGALARALDAAQAAHPGVRVSRSALAAHLAGLAPEEGWVEWLEELYAADVLFALACVRSDPRALRRLGSELMPAVESAFQRVRGAESLRDDARQIVLERLLIGTPQGRPKLETYAGRGPLKGWLRVTALRVLLELANREGKGAGGEERPLSQLTSPGDDPELRHLKRLYSREFKQAFEEALQALDADSRTLLAQYHVDGLTIDQIASLYDVHRATAARRVARAREDVFSETKRRLKRHLSLSRDDLQGVLRLAWSQLDLSVYRILGGKRR